MRVLVCGGRDYNNYYHVRDTLMKICDEYGLWDENGYLPVDLTIITGGAKGADDMAASFAMVHWTGYEEYKADWEKYGKAAGPIRNQQMLDEGKPDLVVAFPGGRGTADMINRARMANIEVVIA